MKNKKDNSEPAFPVETPVSISLGLSMRDYFAAQALTGLLASMQTVGKSSEEEIAKDYSAVAYVVADAMLAERAK